MKENYLVYLKPGVVNWDNYLPILLNLKKKNSIDVLFDDLNTLLQIDINNFYHSFFFDILNDYYIKIKNKIYKVDQKQILKIYLLLKKNKFKKDISRKIYFKIVSFFIKKKLIKKELIYKYVISDINHIKTLFKYLEVKQLKKIFVLRHGLNLFDENRIREKSFVTKLERQIIKREKLNTYLKKFEKKLFFLFYSRSEYIFYKSNLKNLNLRYKIIGIPKHVQGWFRKEKNSKRLRLFENYILIFSRPINQIYFNKDIYFRTMNNIVNLAQKNNLNIVYKFHPKENEEFVEKNLKNISKYLNFKNKLFFTKDDNFNLAQKSSLNICFYSSVSTDFIKKGLLMVEYIEKMKLNESDYAKNNLTLFCNNFRSLEKLYSKIQDKPKNIYNELNKSYNKIFKEKLTLQQICNTITNEQNK